MELVTGYGGKAHITPENWADLNRGFSGAESYVTETGRKFEAELVSNNLLKIHDGCGIMQGRQVVIPKGQSDEVTIQNGTQGMKRIDLVVERYTKNPDTKIETTETVIIKGTPSTNPSVPVHTVGDIRSGDMKADWPLYEVELNGINVVEVRPVFKTLVNMADIQQMLAELNSKILTEEFSKTAEGYTYNVEKYTFGNQKRAIVHGAWTGELSGLAFSGFYQGTIQNLHPVHSVLGLSIVRVIGYNFRCSSGGGSLMILGTATIIKRENEVSANVQFAKSQAKNTCKLEWDMEIELQ